MFTIAISTICDILESNAAAMRSSGSAGILLVIDDLFTGAPPLPEGTSIFYLDSISEPVDDNHNPEISPGLSFLWTHDGVHKFGSSERLARELTDFRRGLTAQVRIDRHLFEFAGSDSACRQLIQSLVPGVTSLSHFSLNAVNKQSDQIERASRALISEVEGAGGRFGLRDLALFLSATTGVDFGLLHLNESPSTVTVVSQPANSPSFFTSLHNFLDVPPPPLLSGSPVPGGSFPAISLTQSFGAELLMNAGLWGKTLASAVQSNTSKRTLILPITRPQGPTFDRTEKKNVLTSADVLIAFTDALNRTLLDVMRACVDTFSQHRYGARRLNLLTMLQRDIAFDNPALAIRIVQSSTSSSLSDFSNTLQSSLDEILYTTSAHSVTVRIFDPLSKELVVAAFAEPEGAFPESSHVPISIGSHANVSVAAFMFLSATRNEPMIYLKRILPSRVEVVNGVRRVKQQTFVPQEFRARGLQTPLMTREATRSEICFTLFNGELAFGTLNLEAPYPYAFDRDIDYLRLIKTGIERLYESVRQTLDKRWVIANASRSNAVHELWQFQESGEVFSKEQNATLEQIFPKREESAHMEDVVSLRLLEPSLMNWIDKRWSDSVREHATRMVKFFHLSDVQVDGNFLEAALVILRNIVQNAVKHSEPQTDRVHIDDRPWYGIRRTPCLRIFYRSSKKASHEILSSLGVSPIQQPSGRVAYGMYNVGLLTRLLGGTLHVTSAGEGAFLTIDIHLPIPGGAE